MWHLSKKSQKDVYTRSDLLFEKLFTFYPRCCSKLTFWTDNSSQYILTKFGSTVKAYCIKQKFIQYRMLEQDGHVESFHKSHNKEYVWQCDFDSFQDTEAAILYASDDYDQHRVHCDKMCDAIRIWFHTDDDDDDDKMSPPILSLLMQKCFPSTGIRPILNYLGTLINCPNYHRHANICSNIQYVS